MEPDVDLEKVKEFWLTEAEEALRVADHLLEKADYSYALFFGHLALEKLLKSLCVEALQDHAPPIHNLVRLAEIAGIQLDESMTQSLILITGFNIETRYPDFRRAFRKKCTEAFALDQMAEIRRVYTWLASQLKLKRS